MHFPFALAATLAASLLPLITHAAVIRRDQPISPGFPYGSTKVRGVNIGGWLVLEPWITPSLFDDTGDTRIVDEFTFGKYQDHDKALAALKNHWDTFYTESDFAAIAAAGLNHVRIPIGYWAFQVGAGEPYITGQLPYLQKAIGWAGKHNLKVIVDLHGAPGSQNGFDNSGQRTDNPTWATNSNNIARTNAIIKQIAGLFKSQTGTVPAIAPLNEPAGYKSSAILNAARQYWFDSYGNIRFPFGTSQQSNTVVVIHDAFQPLSYWKDFMTAPDHQGVAMDTHVYTIFSDAENAMSNSQRIQTVCNKASSLSSFHLWTIVGEFTPSPTDCAKYLNGRGKGSRYDGSFPGSPGVGSCSGKTGSGSSFSSSYKTFLRQFWEAQTITYEKGSGWIQWTWKAENADEWSYQAGLKFGWIPQNPTSRQFPDICG